MSAKRDTVARELARISKRGRLEPRNVVEAARPKESPLHSYFTWENGVAADMWRIHEARNLIRVHAVFELEKDEPDTANVFVSLRNDRRGGRGYRCMTDVLSDKELRAQLLEDAEEDMRYFQVKYQKLSELQPVFAAMARVKARARPAKLRKAA